VLDAALDGRAVTPAEAAELLDQPGRYAEMAEIAGALVHRSASHSPVPWRREVPIFLTNICELHVVQPPYGRKSTAPDAVTLDAAGLEKRLSTVSTLQAEQLTLGFGGLNARIIVPGFEHLPLLKATARWVASLSDRFSGLSRMGFSPDEIELLSVVSGRSHRYVLECLQDHGLQRLGSFHLGLFSDAARQRRSPKLLSVRQWLSIARLADAVALPLEVIQMTPMATIDTRADIQAHFQVMSGLLRQRLRVRPRLEVLFLQPETTSPEWVVAWISALRLLFADGPERVEIAPALPAVSPVFWDESIPPALEDALKQGLASGANAWGGTALLATQRFYQGQWFGLETLFDLQAAKLMALASCSDACPPTAPNPAGSSAPPPPEPRS
jgi:hypothetical protein